MLFLAFKIVLLRPAACAACVYVRSVRILVASFSPLVVGQCAGELIHSFVSHLCVAVGVASAIDAVGKAVSGTTSEVVQEPAAFAAFGVQCAYVGITAIAVEAVVRNL
jgi:hypothetical protein